LSAALRRALSASQANRLHHGTRLVIMETIAKAPITSTLVPDSARLRFMSRHFDFYGIVFERQIDAHMHYLCENYTRGGWSFFELGNGGCYLAPTHQQSYRLVVGGNGFDNTLDAETAGIVVTLFSLSHMSFRFPSVEVFPARFHQLRYFAGEHPNVRAIFAAID